MFERDCLNKELACCIPYSGHQDGLHILSSHTAAGEELAWEFSNIVTNSQISLTAFCSVVNSRYYLSKIPFMSRQTFTDWIFSWLANFRIDFRQACDTCQANPKFLLVMEQNLACTLETYPRRDLRHQQVNVLLHHLINVQCVKNFLTLRQWCRPKEHKLWPGSDDLLFCGKEF